MKDKLKYLIRSVTNLGQDKKCPYCNTADLKKIDSKYVVTSLYKCNNCGLSHRHPKDDELWMNEFYQTEYSVDDYLVTDLPSDDEIVTLKEELFPRLRNYDEILDKLFDSKVKIVDYGCSWGPSVFKMRESGHDAVGFELSKPRAKFGREKLDVPIYSAAEDVPEDNDIVTSSHVIEHLANIEKFVDFAKDHLTEQGLFMIFCPNGNDEYRKREPHVWHVNWGGVHPNCIDTEFARFMFKDNPYLIMTGDWRFDLDKIENWDRKSQVILPEADGKELFILTKPNTKI